MKVDIPIANGFYQSDSLPISNQRCINLFPNLPQTLALGQETLFGTPGIPEIANTGAVQQINRGSHTMAGIFYFVNGNTLFRLNRTVVEGVDVFDFDSLGTVPGSGRVSLSDNGIQLLILVPGVDGFIFTDDPDTFTEITDSNFKANGEPQVVVFADGYFACSTDSKKWIVSNLNNGLGWNALDFATAEADPDIIVAPHVHSNQIYIGGSETIEVFQNIGGSGFPFQRINGFIIPKGFSSKFGVVETNNTFMFLGAGPNEKPAIWELAGGSVRKVSTTAIDVAINKFTDEEIEQSFAWSYGEKGAYFVGFSFADTTFVYDLITQRWHERSSRIDEEDGPWRVNSMSTAYGRVIVCDSKDGRVGELDSDVFTEYGGVIISKISTQPFSNLGNPVFVSSMEMTVESGVGNSDAPDPQIRMSWSDDGKTFNNELSRSMGKIGDFKNRSIWYRLGRVPRLRVFQWVISDPVKRVLIKAEANVRV